MSSQNYFAYGSNLSVSQMTQRCPDSKFIGIGQLQGYKWIISERGYANIVKQEDSKPPGYVVWGLIFDVSEDDVALLDKYESVPEAYSKEALEVDYWPSTSSDARIDIRKEPQRLASLVYVDMNKTTQGSIKPEYIYRMSISLDDALNKGVPVEYIISQILPPVLAGRKSVGSLWDIYRDEDGKPVFDEAPAGSDKERGEWLSRLFSKARALGDAWGSKGRPTLTDGCTAD